MEQFSMLCRDCIRSFELVDLFLQVSLDAFLIANSFDGGAKANAGENRKSGDGLSGFVVDGSNNLREQFDPLNGRRSRVDDGKRKIVMMDQLRVFTVAVINILTTRPVFAQRNSATSLALKDVPLFLGPHFIGVGAFCSLSNDLMSCLAAAIFAWGRSGLILRRASSRIIEHGADFTWERTQKVG